MSANYVAEVRDQLVARLPDLDPALLDLYTLLAIQYGHAVDEVMVHNAWSVWCNRTQPHHKSLIPFPYLAPEVQQLDTPYVEAIRAASLAIYEAALEEHRGGSDG